MRRCPCANPERMENTTKNNARHVHKCHPALAAYAAWGRTNLAHEHLQATTSYLYHSLNAFGDNKSGSGFCKVQKTLLRWKRALREGLFSPLLASFQTTTTTKKGKKQPLMEFLDVPSCFQMRSSREGSHAGPRMCDYRSAASPVRITAWQSVHCGSAGSCYVITGSFTVIDVVVIGK